MDRPALHRVISHREDAYAEPREPGKDPRGLSGVSLPSLSLLAITGVYLYGSLALGWLWLEALMVALALVHLALQVAFRLARRTYRGQMSDGQFFGYAMELSSCLCSVMGSCSPFPLSS